ncbi:type II toxin-antitoxin system Phd/YefM family antitoxin [Patescibacteria group bacterium]|nr:type II toxin-antitoxin system Phd/YefM family antitoxin [Patescibacteria group bacterium]
MKKSIKEDYVTQRDLQVKTKKIVDEMEKGRKFVITRYSKPVGVMVNIEDYFKMVGSAFSSCEKSSCGGCCKEEKTFEDKK